MRKLWQCSCACIIAPLKESVDRLGNERGGSSQEDEGRGGGGGRRSVKAYLLNGRVMGRLCDYEGESLINPANLL